VDSRVPLYSQLINSVCAVIRAVCAFLLVFGMSWLASAEDAKPVTAILLVARAELPDPNFKDAVVLVLNNIAPVPAGLIVNRPTRIAVSSLFPELDRLAKLDDKVYFGGPVEIGSVSFLFRADAPPEHATQVVDGVYLSANEELLRKLLGREKPMEGLRIFVGHSGWGPGQLQAEIARGDWTLAPAETGAIFDGKSEHPWPKRPAQGVGPRT
jgi:putative transcriptional regulator